MSTTKTRVRRRAPRKKAGTRQKISATGKMRSPRGRPDLREDKNLIEKLKGALLAGNSKADAAVLCGIHKDTLRKWFREGEASDEGTLAHEVYMILEKAAAQARHSCLMSIRKAGATNWQASAWFLERTQPLVYGRRDIGAGLRAGEEAGSPDAEKQGEAELTDEELKAAAKAVLKRMG